MHEQGQAFGFYLAKKVSKLALAAKEGVDEVVVRDAQFCQVCTWAVYKCMLFILHIMPVAFSTDSKLVRNSVSLLLEQLNIWVVTGESESGESV